VSGNLLCKDSEDTFGERQVVVQTQGWLDAELLPSLFTHLRRAPLAQALHFRVRARDTRVWQVQTGVRLHGRGAFAWQWCLFMAEVPMHGRGASHGFAVAALPAEYRALPHASIMRFARLVMPW